MNHRPLALLTVLALTSLAALHAAPVQKPNIIFILADDLGFAEIGANRSDRYQTHTFIWSRMAAFAGTIYTSQRCAARRARLFSPDLSALSPDSTPPLASSK